MGTRDDQESGEEKSFSYWKAVKEEFNSPPICHNHCLDCDEPNPYPRDSKPPPNCRGCGRNVGERGARRERQAVMVMSLLAVALGCAVACGSLQSGLPALHSISYGIGAAAIRNQDRRGGRYCGAFGRG